MYCPENIVTEPLENITKDLSNEEVLFNLMD
jgi:hypothetical protein